MVVLLLLGATIPILDQDAAAASAETRRASACAASLEEVRAILRTGRKDVFFSTWKGPGSERIDPQGAYNWSPTDYGRDEHVAAPSRASIADMSGESDLSAVELCPAIRKFLDENNVPYGDQDAQAAAARRNQNMIFAGVSLARVDRDGDRALITEGFSGAGGGGGGWLNLMARDKNGAWHRALSAPTWIA